MNDPPTDPADAPGEPVPGVPQGRDPSPSEVARMGAERQSALDRFDEERLQIIAGLTAVQDDAEAQVAAGTMSLAQAAVAVEAARLEALDQDAAARRAAGAHIEQAALHPEHDPADLTPDLPGELPE
ncbi:hypothetical protein [Actinocorallia longicatena]|uniref:Uncharacterized protein n=1 Tax=Actinocorallia longicatena TaxID=111803 RepID=A0ABP6PX12_9ACTN